MSPWHRRSEAARRGRTEGGLCLTGLPLADGAALSWSDKPRFFLGQCNPASRSLRPCCGMAQPCLRSCLEKLEATSRTDPLFQPTPKTDACPPCLPALNKNKHTYYCKFFLCPFEMYTYPLESDSSPRTWKPFLWNAIVRKDWAAVCQALREVGPDFNEHLLADTGGRRASTLTFYPLLILFPPLRLLTDSPYSRTLFNIVTSTQIQVDLFTPESRVFRISVVTTK